MDDSAFYANFAKYGDRPEKRYFRDPIRPSYSSSRTTASSGSKHREGLSTSNLNIPPTSPRLGRTYTTGAGTDGAYDRERHHSRRKDFSSRQHMANTYAWVCDQDIADMERKNEDTVRWIFEQQSRDARSRTMADLFGSRGSNCENGYVQYGADGMSDDELGDLLDQFAARWKMREERTRRRWEKEMKKIFCEEVLRYQALRQETERRRMAFERRKAHEELRERERLERDRARVQAERDAWKAYEDSWVKINASLTEPDVQLSFGDISWPQIPQPRRAEEISPARITMFLLSSNHSEEHSRKERIKNALRRWHPDRFGRILSKAKEEDKQAVEEGVGIIVRCLNNLMERES